MKSRAFKFAFVLLLPCLISLFCYQYHFFIDRSVTGQAETVGASSKDLSSITWQEWLNDSHVIPSYKWRELLEKSHTDPSLTAKEIVEALSKRAKFSSIDYAYLYVILHNLSLSMDDDWITAEMIQIPDAVTQADWMDVSLEAEFALYTWHSGQRRMGYILLEDTLKKAEQKNYMFLTPRLLNWLGRMALSENELLQAQKYLLRSIYLSKNYDALLSQSRSYYNLYKMYTYMGQWAEALPHIQQARKLHQQLPEPDANTQQLYWYNESVLYGYLSDIDQARRAYQQANQYYQLGAQIRRYHLLDLRGSANIALLQRDFVTARNLIEQCLVLSQDEEFLYNRGRCYYKLASLEVAQENYTAALIAIDKSLTSFQQGSSPHSLLKALKFKAAIFELSSDFVSAYSLAKQVYRTENSQLLDKLQDLTHAQESLDLTLQRDKLNKQYQENRQALSRQSMYLTCAKWLGLLAILVVIGMYIRTYLVKRENLLLEHNSSIDQLTGIHNRHYYYQQLNKSDLVDRRASYHIALFDLDHFKSINDSYGHLVGDEVLKQFALLVQPWINERELFVRWGGEEFLWLIKADEASLARIEQVREVIARTSFVTHKGKLVVTTSIGVSCAATPAELLAHESIFLEADANLYQAKRDGRNQVIWS